MLLSFYENSCDHLKYDLINLNRYPSIGIKIDKCKLTTQIYDELIIELWKYVLLSAIRFIIFTKFECQKRKDELAQLSLFSFNNFINSWHSISWPPIYLLLFQFYSLYFLFCFVLLLSIGLLDCDCNEYQYLMFAVVNRLTTSWETMRKNEHDSIDFIFFNDKKKNTFELVTMYNVCCHKTKAKTIENDC